MTHEFRELARLARKGNIAMLPEKERTVVILRLGWHGDEPKTQAEVAAHLGHSQPYVSTLERQAKERLEQQAALLTGMLPG